MASKRDIQARLEEEAEMDITLRQLDLKMSILLGPESCLDLNDLKAINKERHNSFKKQFLPVSRSSTGDVYPSLPKWRNIQNAAIQQLMKGTNLEVRTLHFKFKDSIQDFGRFMSCIVPAKVDSIFWDTDRRCGFVNFFSHSDAQAFLDYNKHHLQYRPHCEVDVSWVGQTRPMDFPIAEAIIINGATRILRINKVPVALKYNDVWKAVAGGACRFNFVHRIREGEVDRDFAIEFDSIETALWARGVLAGAEPLKGCGFVWVGNLADRVVEGFCEDLNGVLSLYNCG